MVLLQITHLISLGVNLSLFLRFSYGQSSVFYCGGFALANWSWVVQKNLYLAWHDMWTSIGLKEGPPLFLFVESDLVIQDVLHDKIEWIGSKSNLMASLILEALGQRLPLENAWACHNDIFYDDLKEEEMNIVFNFLCLVFHCIH